jgi:serine/threonine-protein kinase
VIHRDLKPDNIFVTSDGSVKVLDFGVAKIVDPANAESSVAQDKKSDLILSLLYAAPEQVHRGNITAATDVYMLGVILYELLTGVQPFAKTKTLSFAEASKVITAYTPPLPSEISESTAGNKVFKGDLDAILSKSMKKKPDDRYQSVDALHSDLQRNREHRPISARVPTLQYRLQKYFKRNRQLVGAASLFSILSVCFLVYHISMLTEERNYAQLEADKSAMVTGFMTDIFSSANPSQNFEDTLTVFQLLDRGKDRIDNINGQPELQADLMLAMGRSYSNLGSYDEAETLLHKADSLSHVAAPDDVFRRVSILNQLGFLYADMRDFEYARYFFDQSYELLDQLSESDWRLRQSTYHGMGRTETGMGNTEDAESWLREAIQLNHNREAGAGSIRNIQVSLAMNLRAQNQYEEAEQLYTEVLGSFNENSIEDLQLMTSTLNNLGYLNRVLERYEEAESYYRRAINIGSDMYGEDHPFTLMVMNNLAATLNQQGKSSETLQILEEKASLTGQRYGKHWRTARAISVVGRFYFQREEFGLAAGKFLESENMYRDVLGYDHFWTGYENMFRHIALKNANQFNESLTTLPSFQAMVRHRDTFTYQDSSSIAYLIGQAEQYSSDKLNDDIRELKAMLNR